MNLPDKRWCEAVAESGKIGGTLEVGLKNRWEAGLVGVDSLKWWEVGPTKQVGLKLRPLSGLYVSYSTSVDSFLAV